MFKLLSKNSFNWWILIIIISTILVAIDFFSNAGAVKTLKSELLTSKPTQTISGPIEVHGESDSVSLHSLSFIDENTGWAVEDGFRSEDKASKILNTVDGGLHWGKIVDTSFAVKKLYFVNKTTGWAAAEDSSNTAKILFTQDGGLSWSSQFEDKINQSSNYDMYFQDVTYGYTLMNGKLFSTSDSGKHWTQINFNVKGFEPQHMSFSNFNNGWIIGSIQTGNKVIVLHTADGGKNWSRQFEKNYADGPVGSVDIDFINSSTGWFLTSNLATWAGELYYTSDGGTNWKKINEIKSVRPTPKELHFVTNKIGWIPLDVGAGPIAGGLLFTQDGGKSFSHIGGEDKMSSAKEVYFTSVNVGYAVFSDLNYGDYIMKTSDGGKSWVQIYPKVRTTRDISFADKLHGFGLSKLSDSRVLLSTADGGDTWKDVYSFDQSLFPLMLSFANTNSGWLLAYGEGNKLVVLNTTDGGKTWSQLNDEFFQTSSYSPNYIKFFNVNEGVMVASNGDSTSIIRTTDGGRTWQADRITPPNNINMFSFVSNNAGYMVSTSGRSPYSVELSKIEDGKTLKQLYQIPSNAFPYGIDFVSKDKGYMLIETSPFTKNSRFELWITHDGGVSWVQNKFPEGFKLELLQSQLNFQFTDENNGWILSSNGLLKTTDGGKTWNWK